MSNHIPVLLEESLDALSLVRGGVYVDATVNRAGHSKRIAEVIGKHGVLVCIDLDEQALCEAREVIMEIPSATRPTVHFVHASFRNLESLLLDLSITTVDGILADLGLSSQELETSKRGFSFNRDEPLTMTISSSVTEDTLTAYDVVNGWGEETIANILYAFADERYSRRIAKAIVQKREVQRITTTKELADIVTHAVPYHRGRIHPATKTFLAIRMAVNDELGAITELIAQSRTVLKKGGRIAIITFHGVEDRHVKQCFREHHSVLTIVNKKAIIPTEEELHTNPRARSAQLRIAEKQ